MTKRPFRTDRLRTWPRGGGHAQSFGRRIRRTDAGPSVFLLVLLLLIAALVVLLPSRTAAADNAATTGQLETTDASADAGNAENVGDTGDAQDASGGLDAPNGYDASPSDGPGLRETSEAFRYTDVGLLHSPWARESGAFSG